MRKLLLTSLALAALATGARAEDFLAVTPGTGANIGGKLASGGGFHPANVLGDATDPRIGAPVSATIGLGVNMLDGSYATFGAKADTASNSAGSSMVSLWRQVEVNMRAAIPTGTNSIGFVTDQGRAATTVPSAASDAALVSFMADKAGKAIVLPYSPIDLAVRGLATVVITTPASLLAASGSGSQFTYLTSIECGNSSGTGVWATLSDGASTQVFVPPTGGNNVKFDPPLSSTAVNTAITVVGDSTQSTVRCAGQGFKGL